MKCKKCGEELPEGSLFCTSCGARLDQEEENTQEVTEEATENEIQKDVEESVEATESTQPEEAGEKEEPKKGKSKKPIIIAVILVLVVIAVIVFACLYEFTDLFESDDDGDSKKEKETNTVEVVEENTIEIENEVNEEEVETVKTVVTSDKRDFVNGLAWSKLEGQWVCVDTSGNVVFKLSSEYTEVTDFKNADYALVSGDEIKAIVDKTGNIITSDDSSNTAFDEIVSDDAYANCVVVSKEVDTYDVKETQYGIIDFEGNWILELSADNAFLDEYEHGLIENIIYDGDEETIYGKIYLVDKAKEVALENGNQHRYITSDDSYIYTIAGGSFVRLKLDGSKEETLVENVSEYSEYSNGYIYLKTEKDGKATYAYYDLKGKKQITISESNVIYASEITEDGNYLIVTENNGGTRYVTLLDKDGEKLIEPIQGAIAENCKYLGENRFLIGYENDTTSDTYVSDENGNKLFSVDSISNYSESIAIKDETNYIGLDGIIMTITDTTAQNNSLYTSSTDESLSNETNTSATSNLTSTY